MRVKDSVSSKWLATVVGSISFISQLPFDTWLFGIFGHIYHGLERSRITQYP